MAYNERTQEQVEQERRIEWEDMEFEAAQVAAKRGHELNLAKLRYATQPRHKAVARCVVAVAKIPALVVLAIMLPVLVLAGREVPQPLADFLIL